MRTPKEVTGPINLGNPDEFARLELAERVIELTGWRSQIVLPTLPADDPRRRQPDITLARERLGWQPSVPLGEGLKRTVGYFDAVRRELPQRAD